jgi:arginase
MPRADFQAHFKLIESYPKSYTYGDSFDNGTFVAVELLFGAAGTLSPCSHPKTQLPRCGYHGSAQRANTSKRPARLRTNYENPMSISGTNDTAVPASGGGLQSLPTRQIRVIGVPLDMGASRRGVDMGPSAMRVAGLEARLEALGHRVTDGGNIKVEIPETQAHGAENARFLSQIAEICSRTADAALKSLEDGMTPLVLGGDHSIAAGSISGVSEFYRRRNQNIGVVWIDAHSDINTPETSPSGNVHGMPLAALLGLGPDLLGNIYGYSPKILPENTVLIGVRDIDAAERANIKRAGVAEVYTMRDIDERGMRTVMEEALRAAGRGTAGYHVSLDMDWIDPEDAPGVGTPVRGGATYREAHLAMEIIADHGRLLSFEMVEVNPVIDEHNRTADLAVELACSAFGKKIL